MVGQVSMIRINKNGEYLWDIWDDYERKVETARISHCHTRVFSHTQFTIEIICSFYNSQRHPLNHHRANHVSIEMKHKIYCHISIFFLPPNTQLWLNKVGVSETPADDDMKKTE